MTLETKEWKQVKTVYLAGKIDNKDDRVDYTGKIPESIIHHMGTTHEKLISKWRLDFLQKWIERNSFNKIVWIIPECSSILEKFPLVDSLVHIRRSDAVLFLIIDAEENINTLLEIAYAKGADKLVLGTCPKSEAQRAVRFLSGKWIELTNDWLESLLIAASPLLIESPIEFRLWETAYWLISQVPIVTELSLYGCESGTIFTRADFIVPDSKIVVYCDGYEFHSEKGTFKRDRIIDKILIANGYLPVRFSGSEIYQDTWGCAAYLNMLAKKNFDRNGEISITL